MGSCIGFIALAFTVPIGVDNNATWAIKPNMANVVSVLRESTADMGLSSSIGGDPLHSASADGAPGLLTLHQQKCCSTGIFAVLDCKNAGSGLERPTLHPLPVAHGSHCWRGAEAWRQ